MLQLLAAAKLTLTLRVLGTRPDGFHELEGLVVMIDEPADVLTVTPGGTGVRVRVSGPEATGVPADWTNLAARAVLEMVEYAPGVRDIEIVIEKSIPPGAGLGGGSSDAAAVLRTLGRALDLPFTDVMKAAAELGSDVPVCVQGGSAWMRGRGERVEPVRLPTLRLLVVVPPFSLPTAQVYAAWDELGSPRDVRPVPAPRSLQAVVPFLVNDLEPAAERVAPELAEFRRELEAAAGLPALLAGSGSAYAVVYDDESSWRDVAARVERALGTRVNAALSLQPYPSW